MTEECACRKHLFLRERMHNFKWFCISEKFFDRTEEVGFFACCPCDVPFGVV